MEIGKLALFRLKNNFYQIANIALTRKKDQSIKQLNEVQFSTYLDQKIAEILTTTIELIPREKSAVTGI
ncbi:MAG TPA: hypothetical protein VI033_07925 [Candidatus Nitrosopolaris sp.]|jgi:hypothetical protein